MCQKEVMRGRRRMIQWRDERHFIRYVNMSVFLKTVGGLHDWSFYFTDRVF